MAERILVVDDEETLCEGLRFNLEAEGFEVDVAYSAEEALGLDLARYDLVMLDIMMGDISGLQMARIMKRSAMTADIPVIFLTARDSEDDMIAGLDLGADDYIMKPYSVRAVLARVRTVLRRAGRKREKMQELEVFRGLILDRRNMTCTVDGREVKLPRKEFEILLRLLSDRGTVFSREQLLREIWTEEVVVLDRVIDVNITRIRQKIGPYGRNIITRSGYGYGFFEKV